MKINTVAKYIYIFILIAIQPTHAVAIQYGTLRTTGGLPPGGITSRTLSDYIKNSIPEESKKLLIFAQCYGGAFASDPDINTIPNTAIGSGTSARELAIYGGYHDDAARELAPGSGRTGALPHNSGVAGGWPNNNPMVSGTLALTDFPLESTKTSNKVNGRVIIIYMGEPQSKHQEIRTGTEPLTIPGIGQSELFSDIHDRERIKSNFRDEPLTYIISVGGPEASSGSGGDGTNGFDKSGTHAGLREAFERAKLIFEELLHRERWQFILFVGDHGDPAGSIRGKSACPPQSRCGLYGNFDSFENSDNLRNAIVGSPNNIPGFYLFASYEGQRMSLVPKGKSFLDLFKAGDLELILEDTATQIEIVFDTSEQFIMDTNGDGILGPGSDEGVYLFFESEERTFLEDILGRTFDININNSSTKKIIFKSFVQTTGGIEKGPYKKAKNISRIQLLIASFVIILVIFLFVAFRRSKP